jgi:hypothetical protein
MAIWGTGVGWTFERRARMFEKQQSAHKIYIFGFVSLCPSLVGIASLDSVMYLQKAAILIEGVRESEY